MKNIKTYISQPHNGNFQTNKEPSLISQNLKGLPIKHPTTGKSDISCANCKKHFLQFSTDTSEWHSLFILIFV